MRFCYVISSCIRRPGIVIPSARIYSSIFYLGLEDSQRKRINKVLMIFQAKTTWNHWNHNFIWIPINPFESIQFFASFTIDCRCIHIYERLNKFFRHMGIKLETTFSTFENKGLRSQTLCDFEDYSHFKRMLAERENNIYVYIYVYINYSREFSSRDLLPILSMNSNPTNNNMSFFNYDSKQILNQCFNK